jgi:hypothetical protein
MGVGDIKFRRQEVSCKGGLVTLLNCLRQEVGGRGVNRVVKSALFDT